MAFEGSTPPPTDGAAHDTQNRTESALVSSTRKQVRQEAARLLAGPCVLEATASTNTTANLVILADYTSTYLQDGHFVGNIMYVSYDAGGANAAPEGEWGRILAYDASAGQFTVDADFTAAVTAGDKVEIHSVTHPTLIHEAIDRALRKMLYKTLAVPSAMDDADMEASTNGWTAGTGATLARTTAAGEFWRGTQANKVTSDATGDRYAYQRASAVEGDTGYIYGVCRNDEATTSCKLVVWDVTNDAEIDSETNAQLAWQSLAFQFTVPSGCEQVEVRQQTVAASKYSTWDHVSLLWAGQRRYALPSWVTEIWQVGRTVYQLEGSNFVNDGRMTDRTAATRWPHIRAKKELATVYIVPSPPFNNNAPVYVECLRHYSALATDSATTDADLDWIAAKAKYECLRMLAAPLVPTEERGEFKAALEEAKMEAAAQDARFQPTVEMPWGFGGEKLWGLQEV